MGDNDKDDVVMLGEYEFKRVKSGLDETQVMSFINELITERDKLAQEQNHIKSLTRLAEKTVAEADRLSEQIKTETIEQTKSECEEIIAKSTKAANEKADAIQAEAKDKVALFLEEEKRRIQDELSNLVHQLFDHLQEEMESLKRQVAATQVSFENKLSQFREDNSIINMESEEGSNDATMEEDEEPDESQEPAGEINQTDKSAELTELIQTEDQAEEGELQWEVEILPPVDMAKITDIMTHLDDLPEVENTDVLLQADTTSIVVLLRDPINIVDELSSLPEVAYVEEVTTDGDSAGGEPKKAQLGFSKSPDSQKRSEELIG